MIYTTSYTTSYTMTYTNAPFHTFHTFHTFHNVHNTSCSMFKGETEQREHLKDCTDSKKIAANAARKEAVASKKEGREEGAEAQRGAEAEAAWRFLGGDANKVRGEG